MKDEESRTEIDERVIQGTNNGKTCPIIESEVNGERKMGKQIWVDNTNIQYGSSAIDSLKYGCVSASRTVMRCAGSKVSNLLTRS